MPSVQLGKELPGPSNEIFLVTDFLGRGAFGEVYRATGKDSGTIIAVKLLPVNQLPDPESQNALLNEVRAAQEVQHPNIVSVLCVDAGTVPDVGPFVCMEYVSGGTLAQILKTNAQAGQVIPHTRALEMMIDLAQGARAINAKLIHRDIKPDNILVDGKALKIGDFGISKFIDESTRSHTFKGGQHMAYMAPEGWIGQTNTYKLDVYSVGIVFYQVLTLKHPLATKVKDPSHWRDWERAHLYEQSADIRTDRPEVSAAVAQLIARMLAKRPDDRPGWDEVLSVLTNPVSEHPTDRRPSVTAAVSAAVEAAVAKERKKQEEELQARNKADARERRLGLYRTVCTGLIQQFQRVIDQFNSEYQFGKVQTATDVATIYTLPTGKSIAVHFFEPFETSIRVHGGEVIGGGWIGIITGRSANLVLVKASADDLYGRWVICEVDIMALANPAKLIGQFGITPQTVVPFGFNDANFYSQIGYAQGGLHVFTYLFSDDPVAFFAALLADAC